MKSDHPLRRCAPSPLKGDDGLCCGGPLLAVSRIVLCWYPAPRVLSNAVEKRSDPFY